MTEADLIGTWRWPSADIEGTWNYITVTSCGRWIQHVENGDSIKPRHAPGRYWYRIENKNQLFVKLAPDAGEVESRLEFLSDCFRIHNGGKVFDCERVPDDSKPEWLDDYVERAMKKMDQKEEAKK